MRCNLSMLRNLHMEGNSVIVIIFLPPIGTYNMDHTAGIRIIRAIL